MVRENRYETPTILFHQKVQNLNAHIKCDLHVFFLCNNQILKKLCNFIPKLSKYIHLLKDIILCIPWITSINCVVHGA